MAPRFIEIGQINETISARVHAVVDVVHDYVNSSYHETIERWLLQTNNSYFDIVHASMTEWPEWSERVGWVEWPHRFTMSARVPPMPQVCIFCFSGGFVAMCMYVALWRYFAWREWRRVAEKYM